jgi:hypothetical protein
MARRAGRHIDPRGVLSRQGAEKDIVAGAAGVRRKQLLR